MFTSTPYGVSTEIPIIKYDGQLLGHLGWVVDRRFLLLLLQLLPSENVPSKDKLYRVGGIPLKSLIYTVGDEPLDNTVVVPVVNFTHVVYAPTELNTSMLHKSADATWKRVYLAHEHVIATMKTTDTSVFESMLPARELVSVDELSSPFYVDPRHSTAFTFLNVGLHPTSPEPAGVAWKGDPPIILRLSSDFGPSLLILGVCIRSDSPVAKSSSQWVAHWAYMVYVNRSSSYEELINNLGVGHDCSKDHISSWPDHSRRYHYRKSGPHRRVTLSFTPFEWDPERTLVPHLRAEQFDHGPYDTCEICGSDR